MGRVAHGLHRLLLPLIVASFLAATFLPAAGLRLGQLVLLRAGLGAGQAPLRLTSLLLALLLLNAGLGVKVSQLGGLLRRPKLLGLGLLANLALPVLFVALLQRLAGAFAPEHTPSLVAGFALLAAMPVAASSTVWSQKSEGDPALSLGLVVCSTCLSPLTTPVVLLGMDWASGGAAGAAIARLGGSGLFLAAFVMVPTAAGVAIRWAAGEEWMRRARPWSQSASVGILLTLCYSIASSALPGLFARPDWAFIAAVLTASVVLCATAFCVGWALAALAGGDTSQRRSLMFGLGLMNGGAGLAMAGSALAHLPGAMLPLIVYTLAQHLVAGAADRLLRRNAPSPAECPPPRRGPAPATWRPRRRQRTVLCPN